MYEMTEQEKNAALRELQEAVRNFPPESERKETVFKSLNSILQALGCYLNDSKTEFKIESLDGRQHIIYKSVYGTFTQSIEGDDPKALFLDALKLLLKNCRELKGSFDYLSNYFNEGE